MEETDIAYRGIDSTEDTADADDNATESSYIEVFMRKSKEADMAKTGPMDSGTGLRRQDPLLSEVHLTQAS
ncbi:hypothetical protein Tco_0340039 [Tanacetum coccineum]